MSRARSAALAVAAAVAATGLSAASAFASPPVLTASSVPTQNKLEALVSWTADQGQTTFKCALEDAKPVDCGSPFAVTGTPGRHTFHIVARNFQGETSTTDLPIDFVDTNLSGPAEGAVVNTNDVKFTASSGYPGAVFECVYEDSPVFKSCGPDIELKNLSDGPHELIVRAHGGATWDRVWVDRHFTVDTTPPDTMLAGDALSSNDPTATFQCRVDGGAWAPCTSLIQPSLGPGYHVQEARAVDPAGNVDATPVQRDWTNPQPPATTITTAQPVVRPAIAAAPETLAVSYRYRLGKASTRITRLSILASPGLKVRVTEQLRAKRLAKWSYTADDRPTSLKGLAGRALEPGTTIRIQAGALKKTLTIRAGRAPKVR